MPASSDGPASPRFSCLSFDGALDIQDLMEQGLSRKLAKALPHAPSGACVCWGIPFDVRTALLVKDHPVEITPEPFQAPWIIFMHTSDVVHGKQNDSGFFSPMRGQGELGEHAADYVFIFEDGSSERVHIKQRHQVGMCCAPQPEACFEAVSHVKPRPMPGAMRDTVPNFLWGQFQNRITSSSLNLRWINWLWAWKNPQPHKKVVGLRFEPVAGNLIVFAISCGDVADHPLRWLRRRKLYLKLPEGELFDDSPHGNGSWKQVQIDLGQVISMEPCMAYPNADWETTGNLQLPEMKTDMVLVEYSAHPEACLHYPDSRMTPLQHLESVAATDPIQIIPPAVKPVDLRVVDKASGRSVPVRLHVHGEHSEYLAPVDRQRCANPSWFQDYCADYLHRRFRGFANPSPHLHHCSYIPGETRMLLPLGRIYIEVSKGFEVRPVRVIRTVGSDTREIVVELEKVLPWREKGWVTADTHVHFLSPSTAMLEGAAEGVNVVNLLASQWGEMMTSVGDFDGHSTFGSREAGGDGEHLVRVGTENRQRVLGHISLLGYEGGIITPLCSGGPDESALGDGVDVLLTQWAMQCRQQGGLTILPHFPYPRCENAAAIVSGNIDGIEMTSWGDLYSGISPYSLSDWYRYLNCGYLVAAVGGTDKMGADMAVGTVRTYAFIPQEEEFTYDAWKQAVRGAHTFVTYGPLMEFSVEGRPPGSWINMTASGGTVDVHWQVASVTVPMSRVELVSNGEILESRAVEPWEDSGAWSVTIDRSAWLALLVRGSRDGQPEMIAAHSSPVMVQIEGSRFMAAADAVTILEQIEGALAYIDTIGTRSDKEAFKSMRLVLTSAHRRLHNRLHQLGYYHEHSPLDDHGEHH